MTTVLHTTWKITHEHSYYPNEITTNILFLSSNSGRECWNKSSNCVWRKGGVWILTLVAWDSVLKKTETNRSNAGSWWNSQKRWQREYLLLLGGLACGTGAPSGNWLVPSMLGKHWPIQSEQWTLEVPFVPFGCKAWSMCVSPGNTKGKSPSEPRRAGPW